MSRRLRRNGPAAAGEPARCAVTVCRGCCCGTPKIPGLDHAEQLARLRQALAGTAQVRVTGCLNACEHANVVVVQPSAAGRAAGGRPVWLNLAASSSHGMVSAAGMAGRGYTSTSMSVLTSSVR